MARAEEKVTAAHDASLLLLQHLPNSYMRQPAAKQAVPGQMSAARCKLPEEVLRKDNVQRVSRKATCLINTGYIFILAGHWRHDGRVHGAQGGASSSGRPLAAPAAADHHHAALDRQPPDCESQCRAMGSHLC